LKKSKFQHKYQVCDDGNCEIIKKLEKAKPGECIQVDVYCLNCPILNDHKFDKSSCLVI